MVRKKMVKKLKFEQLSLFEDDTMVEPLKKSWYIGLPCAEDWWFDLWLNGLEIYECQEPWLIEDYQKTVFPNNQNKTNA